MVWSGSLTCKVNAKLTALRRSVVLHSSINLLWISFCSSVRYHCGSKSKDKPQKGRLPQNLVSDDIIEWRFLSLWVRTNLRQFEREIELTLSLYWLACQSQFKLMDTTFMSYFASFIFSYRHVNGLSEHLRLNDSAQIPIIIPILAAHYWLGTQLYCHSYSTDFVILEMF